MKKRASKLNPAVPSCDEVKRERMTKAVRTVMDYSLGTLWWVDEGLWREQLASRYDQNSTRVAHPGLSMLAHPVQDLFSRIPMLHGSSHGHGVMVKGLTAEEPERLPLGHYWPRFRRSNPYPLVVCRACDPTFSNIGFRPMKSRT